MAKLFWIVGILFFSFTSLLAQTERPDWVGKRWQDTKTTLYFYSTVENVATREDAIEAVINNINRIIANFSIIYVSSHMESESRRIIRNEFDKYWANFNIKRKSHSEVILSGIKIETHAEAYRVGNQQRYRAWAFATIPRQKAEEAADKFAKKISEYYSNQLTPQNNLHNAIRLYGSIIDSLNNNPLRRMIAYHDGPKGRTWLYYHVKTELSNTASSVSFAPLTSQSVQEKDTFEVPIGFSLTGMRNLGPLEYTATVYRINSSSPINTYTFSAGSPLKIPAPTGLGKYEVRLDLLLNKISPHVDRNPTARFLLDVIPATVGILYRGNPLTDTEKMQITQSIQHGLQNSRAINIGTPSSGAPNKYNFIVTVNRIQYPATGVDEYEITIDFVHNGTPIAPSLYKKFFARNWNFVFNREIIPFIRESEKFFKDVERSFGSR